MPELLEWNDDLRAVTIERDGSKQYTSVIELVTFDEIIEEEEQIQKWRSQVTDLDFSFEQFVDPNETGPRYYALLSADTTETENPEAVIRERRDKLMCLMSSIGPVRVCPGPLAMDIIES